MKIVAISLTQVPSTAANSIQVMKACQGLVQLGHDVTLIVPGPSETKGWDELAAFYGIQTHFEVHWLEPASFGARPLFTWHAVRYAKRLKADLLYVWPVQSAVFAPLFGLPVLLEMHDFPTGRYGPWWYKFFVRMPGHKRQLCITHALEKLLEQDYGTHLRANQKVIGSNAVDLERFIDLPDPPTARQQLGLPEAPTIVCTGHLYSGRGGDLFLVLAKTNPKVNFLWIGGRPEDVDAYRTKAVTVAIDNAIFAGFIPNQNLPQYQAAAEILLMPYGKVIGISGSAGRSAEISSPMKMFEYLAAERAIITSDLPVFREVLNESNAAFALPDDISSWNPVLRELLVSPEKRKQLSTQARQDAGRYTWKERARRALENFV
jgi:glycosyltransferase involved in cell wall biosynthesis